MSGSSFGRSPSKAHFVRRLERGGEPSVWSGSSYAADPVRQKLHRGPVEFFLSSWDTLWLRELCVRATLLSKARPAGFSADLSASKSQSRILSKNTRIWNDTSRSLSPPKSRSNPNISSSDTHRVCSLDLTSATVFILCVKLYFSYDSMTSDTVECPRNKHNRRSIPYYITISI